MFIGLVNYILLALFGNEGHWKQLQIKLGIWLYLEAKIYKVIALDWGIEVRQQCLIVTSRDTPGLYG